MNAGVLSLRVQVLHLCMCRCLFCACASALMAPPRLVEFYNILKKSDFIIIYRTTQTKILVALADVIIMIITGSNSPESSGS